MNKNIKKDKLLNSFIQFKVGDNKIDSTIGGTTNGSSGDPDGCTAIWFDRAGGGYSHTDDYITCD